LARGFAQEEVSALLAGKPKQFNARSVRTAADLHDSGDRDRHRVRCAGDIAMA
jgi:hypothetical protein